MRRTFVGLLLALCSFAPLATAQIVNVLPFARSVEEGFRAEIRFGVDWREGNTAVRLLRLSGNGSYRTDASLVLFLARGEIGEKRGERFASAVFEHVRYRHRLAPHWQVEGFVQHEYDEFRRLSLRALVGTGLRFEWRFGERGLVAVGTAAMAELERLRDGEPEDAGGTAFAPRSSSYLSVEVALDERVELKETLFVQPRFDDPRDVRILNETTLSVRVRRRVTLPTSFTVRHDSEPPEGVKSTDTALRTSFAIAF